MIPAISCLKCGVTQPKYNLHFPRCAYSPLAFENPWNTSIINSADFVSPFENKIRSSANLIFVIWRHSHLRWKLKFGCCCSFPRHLWRYSIISTNSRGEMGSPYLCPRFAFSKLVIWPLIEYLYETICTHSIIQCINLSGKFSSYKIASSKDHSTVS